MDSLGDVDLSSLKVVKYPAEVLRRPCLPVELPDQRLERLVRAMFDLMYSARGVGLAAPQVGIALRLFVANRQGEPGESEAIYINPRILRRDGQVTEEEGCLSVPGVSCRLKRSQSVTIRAVDLRGQQFEQTGEGLLGRIFQHEIDHLEGRLILNRMSAVARLANRHAIKDLEAEYARSRSVDSPPAQR